MRRDPEIPGTTNGEWAFERVGDNDVDALWVVGIACDADVSGAGTCQHLIDVFEQGMADAAIVASMIHTGQYSIEQIKRQLTAAGVLVRQKW